MQRLAHFNHKTSSSPYLQFPKRLFSHLGTHRTRKSSDSQQNLKCWKNSSNQASMEKKAGQHFVLTDFSSTRGCLSGCVLQVILIQIPASIIVVCSPSDVGILSLMLILEATFQKATKTGDILPEMVVLIRRYHDWPLTKTHCQCAYSDTYIFRRFFPAAMHAQSLTIFKVEAD